MCAYLKAQRTRWYWEEEGKLMGQGGEKGKDEARGQSMRCSKGEVEQGTATTKHRLQLLMRPNCFRQVKFDHIALFVEYKKKVLDAKKNFVRRRRCVLSGTEGEGKQSFW
eukprot:3244925-Rhodomonas_salina.4